MRIIRRAFQSVTRRASRSALLILVMTACVALALSGLSISAASREAARLAREKLGATVTLRVDSRKLMQAVQNGDTTAESVSRTVPLAAATEIAKLPQVKAYNYTSSTSAVSETLEPVEIDSSSDTSTTTSGQTAKSGSGTNPGMLGPGDGRGFGGNANFVQPDFQVEGALESGLLSTFASGTATITEGRALTADDTGKAVCLIETQLASANSLKLGDTITLQSVDKSAEQSFQVVGIYQTDSSVELSGPIRLAFMNPVNTIYLPYDQTATLSTESDDSTTTTDTIASSGVSSVQYLLGDPTQIDAFKTAAQAVNLNWDWYKLDANDSRYEQMVAPIENVAASSNIVVIVTAVAGAAILALLLLLSLRDRTREIGVLLSLGEKKSALAGQMVIEALMLIVVAFVFGSLIGGGIAGRIGNSLLAREVTTSQTLAQQGAAGQVMLMGGRGQQSLRSVTPISTINVKAGLTELMQAGGVVLATVFAAVLLPVANLLRLKPRQILIRHE